MNEENSPFPPGLRALVVDDVASVRMMLGKKLERIGLACALAENGEAALARLEAGKFDVMITDCNMPVLNGFDLTRRVRALEAARGDGVRLPIIALSSDDQAEEIAACHEAGMDGFLSKTADRAGLTAMLARWLPTGAPVAGVGPAAALDLPHDAPPVLDLSAYLELFGSVTAPLREALTDFLAEAPTMIAEVEQAQGAAKADAAHALAGAALTAGMMRFGALAREIEQAAKEGADPRELERRLGVALAEASRAVAAL
ncbi:MAG: response regulator [Elsteraceae bacterium]